jgi:hypothetical protein
MKTSSPNSETPLAQDGLRLMRAFGTVEAESGTTESTAMEATAGETAPAATAKSTVAAAATR